MDLADRIVDWLKEQVSLANKSGAVLGLSGGLDSAVVSALCKRAFGEGTLGLILPCESIPGDIEDARRVAERFQIETVYIDLSPVFESLMGLLSPGRQVSAANLKPRLRMLTLYYFANERDYLVVGTGNKSEIKMGYFTKHGDGGVDILPLGGLYKSQVTEVARALGIPSDIIEKPPSAGLWAGQTDEEEMGITYKALDFILRSLEAGTPSAEDPVLVEQVEERLKAQAHKCRSIPIFYP